MSFDSTQFMAQMAELRNNRDDADVTFNCQGELIKAHSFILGTRYACTFPREKITQNYFSDKFSYFAVNFMRNPHSFLMLYFIDFVPRSEYFKTLNSIVGNNNEKVLKVDECSPQVLSTVVDFIYGIGIPENCSKDDARSLLAMADLYIMDDLKDAVGSLIATKQTTLNNILDIVELAETYSNKKLKEMCCNFIFQNLGLLNKKKVAELCEAMPMLGEKALLELQQSKGRPQNSVDVANKILGIRQGDPFKKRGDFRSEDDYKGYVMGRIQPNMVVLCNKRTRTDENPRLSYKVSEGTIGRVTSLDFKGANVKWVGYTKAHRASFTDLDLLTPPIASSLFQD